ncbi:hypothetical protein CERSUDRAFT_118558 [Gelatoporia subvermispora B]|uniref:CCHC-type domain-containing protein n=1 Tax=Ceriporiopsis subvermispora (strain B) TaxID=914234 RepID=M2R0Z0_CERS8|nr:hypothetical protein CERSUDRAFT_118558 [Gelatoporia subvermispora B]
MQAWIGNIRSMAFRIGEADIVVSEQDQILAVTMGLPPSYDTVIIALDSTPTEQLTLERVVSRLLNEEIRQSSSGAPQSHSRSRDPGVAAATMKALIRGEMPKGRLIDRSEVQCYFCDNFGHFKSECPEKAKWETEKAKTKEAEAAGGHSAILATTFGPVAGAW